MSVGLAQAVGIGAVVVIFAVVLSVIFLLASAIRIVNEYERGVIFRTLTFLHRGAGVAQERGG